MKDTAPSKWAKSYWKNYVIQARPREFLVLSGIGPEVLYDIIQATTSLKKCLNSAPIC